MRSVLGALLSLAAFQAQAIPISTSIGDYEVTTLDGTFDALSTTLMAQVWWGDVALANEFALLVGGDLGGSGPNRLGPRFAVCSGVDCLRDATDALTVHGVAWVGLTGQLTQFASTPGGPLVSTWAVAERIAVPEPGTTMLLLAGLLGSAIAGRRRNAVRPRD